MPSPKTTKGPEYVALGAALRKLRKTAGLTQVQAGEKARIRSNFLSQVEGGKRGVTWETFVALLAAYDASLHDFADAYEAPK
jgi:transcriptional regulator with XRE-family HTH domain